MSDTPREPTSEECAAHARVGEGWACWYPQMGGYVGKAVATLDHGCWDVYVWHDGDFPFSGDSVWPGEPAPSPTLIHHCDPGQFIAFGQFLEGL